MKYEVKITETLETFVTVEANSPDEAELEAQDMWENADIILGAEEFVGVEFNAEQVEE